MGYKPGPSSHPDPWTSPDEGKAPEVVAASPRSSTWTSALPFHLPSHPVGPRGTHKCSLGSAGGQLLGGCLGPHLTSLQVSDGPSSPSDLVCHQEWGPVVTAESPPKAFSGSAECKGAI